MGNRGTTRSWDDEEIAKYGLFGHLANVRRGLRRNELAHKRQRDEELTKLIVLLRKQCSQSKQALAWHKDAIALAHELCEALHHTTFLGGPCQRCITASQKALELLNEGKA
jgi:hypothetical protein